MSDFISIKINENIIKKLKFSNEYLVLSKLNSVNTIDEYIEYLTYLFSEINQSIVEIEDNLGIGSAIGDKRDVRLSKITGVPNVDLKMMQVISDLKQYSLKIEIFLKEYRIKPGNWVLETYQNEKSKIMEYSLEPIWAYDYLEKYIWSRYDTVVLMSGTILDKNLFSKLNGIDLERTVYYSVPSPFPLKNRMIYYMPLGKMSYNKKETTFKNFVPWIHKILAKYKGSKGIIHTNSFELSNWIENDVKNERLIFHDSENKTELLRMHFESDKDTVFVSPSASTGISFDHDKSRFQIIAKIPYPSLGSQKNKLRKEANSDWYSWKTCCNLQQATGRSVRSMTDYADTIIIDESFGDIIKYNSKYLPEWFQVSIKKVEVKK